MTLAEELRSLGSTASGIKRKLVKAGCLGLVDSAMSNPISRWLEKRGWNLACIPLNGPWFAYRDYYAEYSECEPPEAAKEFMRRFDAGDYADLIGG